MEALRLAAAAAILSVSASWTAHGQTPGEPAAQSQAAPAFSVLYTFTGGADGAYPEVPSAPLILDRRGNLYGTTGGGGTSGYGVVFKLDPAGTETVLHSFTGGADGSEPYGLIRDAAGNFYGTTYSGGSSGLDAGTVFKLTRDGKQSVLYNFSGGTDGNTPGAGVMRDEAGNLYGTTIAGGTVGVGFGVVFKVDPAGTETVLYSFAGLPTDGIGPSTNLLRDKAGNLYGMTSYGGSGGGGVVFKLDPSGKETVLYNFTGGADGSLPFGWLIEDREGNLYGTTAAGGGTSAPACFYGGCGVVFKLDPSGKQTVLYAFTGGTDGAAPFGGLVRDAAGNLYGTAYSGGDLTGPAGAFGEGVVFRVDPAGKETVLYTFTGLADGGNPETGLVLDKCNLYGTASGGGDLAGCSGCGAGTVFKLTLPKAAEAGPN